MINVNHITYNTGNNVVFSSNDIDKTILFQMKNFVNDAKKNKLGQLLDGVKFKLTQESDMYVATLYYNGIPFLITYGSKNKSNYIWDLVTETAKKLLPTTPTMLQPQAPYVIDLLLPFLAPLSIYQWTGDFTKCLFWYLLMDYKEKGI